MFKPQELELLICGSPTLDFHALEEVAILEDGSDNANLECARVSLRYVLAGTSKGIRLFACCGRCCIRSTWNKRRNSFSFAPAVIAHPSKALAPWFSLYLETDQIASDCQRGAHRCLCKYSMIVACVRWNPHILMQSYLFQSLSPARVLHVVAHALVSMPLLHLLSLFLLCLRAQFSRWSRCLLTAIQNSEGFGLM